MKKFISIGLKNKEEEEGTEADMNGSCENRYGEN